MCDVEVGSSRHLQLQRLRIIATDEDVEETLDFLKKALSSRSFVHGFSASSADMMWFDKFALNTNFDGHPHVRRWFEHINSLPQCDRERWRSELKRDAIRKMNRECPVGLLKRKQASRRDKKAPGGALERAKQYAAGCNRSCAVSS